MAPFLPRFWTENFYQNSRLCKHGLGPTFLLLPHKQEETLVNAGPLRRLRCGSRDGEIGTRLAGLLGLLA